MSPQYSKYERWLNELKAQCPGWEKLPPSTEAVDTLRNAKEELPPEEFQYLISRPELAFMKSAVDMDSSMRYEEENRLRVEEERRARVIEAARQNRRAREEKLGTVEDRKRSLFERMKQTQEIIQKGRELLSTKTPATSVPALLPPATGTVGGAPTTTPLLEAASEQTAPKKKVTLNVLDPLDSIVEGPTATFTRQKTGGAGIGNGIPARTIGTTAPSTPSPTVDDLIRDLQNANLPRRISTPEVQSAIREATFPSVDARRQEALRMLTQGALDDSRRVQRALDAVGGTTPTSLIPSGPIRSISEAPPTYLHTQGPLASTVSNARKRHALGDQARLTGFNTVRPSMRPGEYVRPQSGLTNPTLNLREGAPKRPVGNTPPLGGGSLSPLQSSFEDLFGKRAKRAGEAGAPKGGAGPTPGASPAGTSATGAPKGAPKGATPLGNMDELGAWFKKAATKANPQFSAKSGLKLFGAPLGMVGGGVNAIAQGAGAVDNLKKFNDTKSHTRDLQNDIMVAAMNNPMSTYGLTPDQIRLLGEVRRGKLKGEADVGSFDIGNALKEALIGGGIGLAGGLPMAAVGALAGGVKGGLTGLTEDQERQNAQLEALYHALNQSNARYNAARNEAIMKRYF